MGVDHLIDTLSAQHEAIRVIAAAIDVGLAGSDVGRVRVELQRLTLALRAHLHVEDAQLYPALAAAASRTRHEIPARIAITYERNMEHVSAALKAFLERYATGDHELDDLRRDWQLVSRMLIQRQKLAARIAQELALKNGGDAPVGMDAAAQIMERIEYAGRGLSGDEETKMRAAVLAFLAYVNKHLTPTKKFALGWSPVRASRTKKNSSIPSTARGCSTAASDRSSPARRCSACSK